MIGGREEASLQKEAEKRDEWRDRNPVTPDADGHTPPASEDEDERLGGGGDAVGHPGTLSPPD